MDSNIEKIIQDMSEHALDILNDREDNDFLNKAEGQHFDIVRENLSPEAIALFENDVLWVDERCNIYIADESEDDALSLVKEHMGNHTDDVKRIYNAYPSTHRSAMYEYLRHFNHEFNWFDLVSWNGYKDDSVTADIYNLRAEGNDI